MGQSYYDWQSLHRLIIVLYSRVIWLNGSWGGGGGVLPEKLGGGVRPASQNSYPIYDQNLQYSLPYLWPDQKFETQFMTRPSRQNPVSDLHYN